MANGASWLCLVFWLGFVSEPAKEGKQTVQEAFPRFSPLPLALTAVMLMWPEMDEV